MKQLPLGPEVQESIMAMVTVCAGLLARPRPPPPPGGRGAPGGGGRDGGGAPGAGGVFPPQGSGPPGPRILPPGGLFPPGGHNPESLASLSSQVSGEQILEFKKSSTKKKSFMSFLILSPQFQSSLALQAPPASSAAFSLPGVNYQK